MNTTHYPKKKCCVPGCNDLFSMRHSFPPLSASETFSRWKEHIKNPIFTNMDNKTIRRNYVVCDLHFRANLKLTSGRIQWGGIPTLNLPGLNVSEGEGSSRERSDVNIVISNERREGTDKNLETQDDPEERNIENIETMNVEMGQVDSREDVNKRNSSEVTYCCSRKRTSTSREINRRLSRLHGSCRKKIRYLRRKNYSYRKRIRMAKKFLTAESLQPLMQSVNAATYKFIISQAKNQRLRLQGRRYSHDDKVLALSLYKSSPKSYRLLSKVFALPQRRTLMKMFNKIIFNCGINKKIFDHLKEVVRNIKATDRYCTLVFDEMSLQPSLSYNSVLDIIEGFEDFGSKRTDNFADHVLVFMVRGIFKKWKQPVCYVFCQGTTKTPDLAELIKTVIREVRNTGLKVVATVCDQGQTNQSAINSLIEESQTNLLRLGLPNTYKGFLVDGKEVVPLYDFPHLLKGLRNNLLTKDLEFQINGEVKIASWRHVVEFYENDTEVGKGRYCPKLTDFHVLPNKIKKMKVSCCTQVFSQRVGSIMKAFSRLGNINPEADSTADLILFLDDLFDSVNGGALQAPEDKPLCGAITKSSPHKKFWVKAVRILNSMKFVCLSTNQRSRPPSLKNWVRSIENLQYIWNKLEAKGIKHLVPRNLNQDPLENFFGSIRSHGYRNNKPTASSFVNSFKSLIINNFTSSHSVGSNCELDESEGLLATLKTFFEETTAIDLTVAAKNLESTQSRTISQGTVKAFFPREPIATAVAKEIQKLVKDCGFCSSKLKCDASSDFMVLLNKTCDIIALCLPSYCTFPNVVEELYKLIIEANLNTSSFDCNEHPVKKCLQLIVSTTIFNWVKTVNRILRGVSSNFKVESCNDPILEKSYYYNLKFKRQ